MSDNETLSEEEKSNVKPWRLPFWTQPPDWEADTEAESEDELANTESEEIDSIQPPSAEELESIRREAYNDGLEQGLIEGRQKGQQEGHEQGFQQGLEEGKASGHSQGYAEGVTSGEQAGNQSAIEQMTPISERLNQLVTQLHTCILERDAQLPNTITLLVMSVCEQVLKHELKTGTPSIHKFVQSSLAELPEGAQNLEAQVAQEDYHYLQQALQESRQELKVQINPELESGVCKVKSSQSLVDYSAYEHLQKILEPLAAQLLKAVDEEGSFGAEQIVLHDSVSNTQEHQEHQEHQAEAMPDAAEHLEQVSHDEQTQPPVE